MLNERPMPVGIAAHAVPGSWRPGEGTMQAAVDDTDASHTLAVALGDENVTQCVVGVPAPICPAHVVKTLGPRRIAQR